MTPARQATQSAAHRAAHALREEILEREDGELLGSEDELMRRLGVSRPTLRQAARLLEHEQVLTVRRGVKGGYYARKPDIGSLAHVAAFHLRARGTTLRETFLAAQPLIETAIRRASSALDPTGRKEALADFLRPELDAPAATMLRRETDFMECVLELSANPPIELFVRILNQFGISQTNDRVFGGHSDRIPEWATARAGLAEAIVAGDPEMAALLSRRRGLLVVRWLTEDFGQDFVDELLPDEQAIAGTTDEP